MKRRTNIILIVCGVVVMGSIAVFIGNTWSLVPTKSTPNELTIVLYGGFSSNQPVVTLRHHTNDTHINDYVLEVKNGIHVQETQKYTLPQLNEGMVEVNVELGDKLNGSFTKTYNQARDLYEKGLLLYLTDDKSKHSLVNGNVFYDQYVYFVSGIEKICYFREAYSSEWSIITDAPSLKKFKRNEPMPFISIYSGWKENEWVVTSGEQTP